MKDKVSHSLRASVSSADIYKHQFASSIRHPYEGDSSLSLSLEPRKLRLREAQGLPESESKLGLTETRPWSSARLRLSYWPVLYLLPSESLCNRHCKFFCLLFPSAAYFPDWMFDCIWEFLAIGLLSGPTVTGLIILKTSPRLGPETAQWGRGLLVLPSALSKMCLMEAVEQPYKSLPQLQRCRDKYGICPCKWQVLLE